MKKESERKRQEMFAPKRWGECRSDKWVILQGCDAEMFVVAEFDTKETMLVALAAKDIGQ